MLRAENLSLVVPGKSLVQNLSIEFLPGEFWAVLGKNGSGKTTLLNALCGIVEPYSKKIKLNQSVISSIKPTARAKQIGLLLQKEDSTFYGTVKDYVLLGRFPHRDTDLAFVHRAASVMQIDALAGRRLEILSGGEFQRARIAQLLCQDPEIYCLDEPLMHLDVAHQYAVMEWLRNLTKQGKTVIMAMHEPLWTLRYCTHALLLFDGGEYAAGEAASLLTADKLQKLYSCKREALSGFGML
ncbi:MAG: ABC transporter ATP-binding protein [Burkholderiales bacterium]